GGAFSTAGGTAVPGGGVTLGSAFAGSGSVSGRSRGGGAVRERAGDGGGRGGGGTGDGRGSRSGGRRWRISTAIWTGCDVVSGGWRRVSRAPPIPWIPTEARMSPARWTLRTL